MKRLILIFILLPGLGMAQPDSIHILTYAEYMQRVQGHHPLAIQADLALERGEAGVLQSRGAFDPKTFADVGQKYFDDKTYYSRVHGGLKIPTWFGLEVAGGFQQNDGVFLNPAETLPEDGLWYAGITVPLGQNLFIDQRRTELRKAKIYRESTEAERQVLLNELLLNAGKVYWNWFQAYHAREVYRDAVIAAQQRLGAVKLSAKLGDRPQIDTLEAGLQLQNRQMDLQQAELEVTNASAALSVYMWEEGSIPLEPAAGTQPSPPDSINSETPIVDFESFIQNHPELQQYRYKIKQLELDKRLKKERLKPEVNLKYNALLEPVGTETWENYNSANYTWGLEFSFPLFLRKERGALKMADIYIRESEYELQYKEQALRYQLQTAVNEWQTTGSQLDIFRRTVRDYESLLKGERRKFEAGESSLFMVNSRELNLINSQVKLLQLQSKRKEKELEILFRHGKLFSSFP
ncbi:MAG: TolC family protein [Owenweeksia sp.]